ncbi:MAG TPA: hypothetical protein VG184_02815 [Acidimicrobiales bacterium]|nr:hypothetical protein [Acidimicrobiales bacterium]
MPSHHRSRRRPLGSGYQLGGANRGGVGPGGGGDAGATPAGVHPRLVLASTDQS